MPRLVYSTDPDANPRDGAEPPDGGRAPGRSPRPGAGRGKPTRRGPPQAPAGADARTAYIRREKGGRGGKTVTVVYNLTLAPDDLKALAKRLKTVCGTGGTVKDGTIEIQGDHREALVARLHAEGFKTKLAGG